MIINNFSPIELKEARKIVDEVKVEEKIEKLREKKEDLSLIHI